MARRKSRWVRRLDAKRLAFAALLRLTRGRAALRRLLGFYPLLAEPPPEKIDDVALDERYPIRLRDPRWAEALAAVAPFNWDVRRPEATLQDDWTSRIFVGFVRDVEVPGHTLVPIDPERAVAVTFGLGSVTNWNFARPGLPRLRTERITHPALVLPPHRNYWHLLVEHLLPLIEAWRLRAWGDAPLAIVTRTDRPPLIDAVLDGLRREGATISVVTPGAFTTLRLDRMLLAANLCSNAEHSHALARTIPAARRVLAAAYRDRPAVLWPPRLYVTRRGARLRRLVNEDELVRALANRGFAVIEPGWDAGPDQIAAFSGAEIVVGPHGAGLTNVIWSRPGTALVELFPFDHRKTPMLHLCAEHDLVYRAVLGGPEQGRDQAFCVDVPAVLRVVDAALARSGAA